MVELILLVIALFTLSFSAEAGVFLCVLAVAVAFYRRRTLQQDVEKLQSSFTEQADALRREIHWTRDKLEKVSSQVAELQIAADARGAYATTRPQKESSPEPVTLPVVATPIIVAPAESPAPTPPAPVVKPIEVAKPSPATPEVKPVGPKPAAAAPPPPPPPITKPVTSPVTPQTIKPPIERPTEAVQPPRPATPAASVRAPQPPAFRVQKPQPSIGERLRKALDLEEALGTNWLTKIGIVLVVLGVALFGMYELSELGPHGKVLLLAALGAAILGFGISLDRGDRYRIIGRTAIGGGWALLFFTSYGAHHVDAMRVLFSETPDLVLMLAVAVAMALHTLRYRSQAVTGMAFLLAYSTITLTHDTVYALTAGATLAVGIVIIAIRMQWFELEVFGILSSYLNHLYWLYKLLGVTGANHHPFPEFTASTAILAFYWLVYRFSYIARKIENPLQENISAVAALLNTILLLVVMKFQSAHPELAFYALLVLGAFELMFGQVAQARHRRKAFILLSILGASLMIMAVPFRYSGENRAILWMIGAEAFIAAGIILRENVFRRIGNVTALLVALHILVIELVPLFHERAATSGPLLHSGTLLLSAGLLFYVNAHPLRLYWPELYSERLDQGMLTAQSYFGAFTLSLGLWAIVSWEWTALAWALLLVALAFASWRYKTIDVYQQALVLALVTAFRTLLVNYPPAFAAGDYPHMPRILIVPLIAAAMYLSAWPIGKAQKEKWPVNLLTWLGTGLLSYLVATDVQHRWLCVAWLCLGIALVGAARRWKLNHLCYQEHILAVVAAVWALGNLSANAGGTLTQRIVPALLVAAGLYAVSRKASLWTDERERLVAYLHTWAATSIVVGVAYVEFDTIILPMVWMGFALLLALIARRFLVKEFTAQAHTISALAIIQTIGVVLPSETRFHGISERLLITCAVMAALYAMTRLVPMSEEHRKLELHHIYTWVASFLGAGLLWYELQPLSVAVGWALLGLMLFEVGTMRPIRQLRFQGYVALFSSFGRIFVVNLAAGGQPGDWMSPRMLTVMPVALILFFVYAQVAFSDDSDSEGRFDITSLLAYAGSITIVSILYFQVSPPWIAAAWSVLIPLLLAAALLLEQEVFLQQAILLSVAIFSRGMIHNLFGGSYFTDSGWKGRFAELGSAIIVMLLSLPLAFKLKQHFVEQQKRGAFRNMLTRLTRRPEQVVFFVPVVLLTFMLALKMRSGMVTVAWGMEGVAVFLLALALGERSFRLTGLALLMLCVGKILVIDAWRLAPRDKYLTFIALGSALIAVSFLWTRYRETIRQYL